MMLSALLALAGVPAAEAQRPALILEPSSPWVLDYEQNACALRRSFGGPGREMILQLDDYTFTNLLDVTVVSGDIRSRGRTPKVGFEPTAELKSEDAARPGIFPNSREGVMFEDNVFTPEQNRSSWNQIKRHQRPIIWSEDARTKRELEITGYYVGNAFQENVLLNTGEMHSPMEAMRKCLSDLGRRFGVDPAGLYRQSRPASFKNQEAWLPRIQHDYPAAMVRDRKTAFLRIRLIVDEKGRSVDCLAREDGQPNEFTQTACKNLLAYAEFEPALDASGHPVASVMVTSMSFQFR